MLLFKLLIVSGSTYFECITVDVGLSVSLAIMTDCESSISSVCVCACQSEQLTAHPSLLAAIWLWLTASLLANTISSD